MLPERKALQKMPSKDPGNVELFSTVRLNDSGESGVALECALSRERSSVVASSETEVWAAVRSLQDQHTGKPGTVPLSGNEGSKRRSGVLTMRIINFTRKRWDDAFRAPWCALTVLFWSYDHLARRLRVLPGKLKPGMSY